jgi:hypothetical protein
VGGAVALWPAPERVQAAAAPARGRVEAGERPGREGALRYNLAAGARSVTGARAASGEDDRPVAEFDERQTRALIQAGWRPAGGAEAAGAFARHAERVATLAAVARAQGYKPSVGAMQANLGTLAETAGRVAPEEWRTLTELRRAAREMRAARLPSSEVAAAEARVAALEGALAERVEAATGAPREEAGWATINLDVNADGVVDVGDLADAEREARR